MSDIPPQMTTGTLVVGAGQAALSLVTALRELGDTEGIVMAGAESHLPYERPPLSKGVLAGSQDADSCVLRDTAWYDEQRIDVLAGDPVLELSRQGSGGRARMSSGRTVAFERLALATGALAAVPPTLAGGHANVVTVRTLTDAAHLAARARDLSRVTGSQAVVVGGGFLGLEVAAVLRAHGLEVTVIEAAQRLMARSVSPLVSRAHRAWHEGEGTRILLGTLVTGIRSGDGGDAGGGGAVGYASDRLVLLLAPVEGGPTSLTADLVVVCTGAVPDTRLAEQLELEVAGGIVITGTGLTSDGRTVAAGDCTVSPVTYADALGLPESRARVRLESVDNAESMGARAAASLLGRGVDERHVPWFWSDQGPLRLQVAGLPALGEEHVLRGEPGDAQGYTVLHLRRGQLVASECVDRPADHVVLKRTLDSGRRLDTSDRSQLADPLVPLRKMLRK